MANLQTQFLKFHDAIKIDFDDNQLLRDKRDLVVRNLKDGLKTLFSRDTPTFDCFNQGSYDLATGVEPLAGEDYDIDVGIVFNFSKNSFKPVEVKKWVYDALNTGSRTLEIKRPCVRVQYHHNGAKWFHVDLAIYSLDKHPWLKQELHHIAKGFWGSSEDKKIWELSEPFKLKELLKSKITNLSDREQFRRIIRYLKRWKDCNFSSTGSERPTGIALTACTYNLFKPQTSVICSSCTGSLQYQYDDLKALHHVVDGIIGMFNWKNEISVKLPVEPYNDLFAKMNNNQMVSMQIKLINLQIALSTATMESNTLIACAKLKKIFGQDFPNF